MPVIILLFKTEVFASAMVVFLNAKKFGGQLVVPAFVLRFENNEDTNMKVNMLMNRFIMRLSLRAS